MYKRQEKSLFSKPCQQRVIIENRILKNFGIGLKYNSGSGFFGIPDDFELLFVVAALKMLEKNVLSVFNGQVEALTEGVNHRCADAVQTAGYLISAASKLSSRMENGINNRRR